MHDIRAPGGQPTLLRRFSTPPWPVAWAAALTFVFLVLFGRFDGSQPAVEPPVTTSTVPTASTDDRSPVACVWDGFLCLDPGALG